MTDDVPSRRKPRVKRPRPAPAWIERSRRVAWFAVPLLLVAGATGVGVWTGWIDRRAEEVTQSILKATADAGLVVRQIVAEGRSETDQADLLEAIGVRIGDPLLGVDMDAVKARVEELPWVERAEVVRQLPDTLLVRLGERRPVALWQSNGRHWPIDGRGDVIEHEDPAAFADLIIFVGEHAPKRARDLLGLMSAEPGVMRLVRAATLVGDRRWDLLLRSGIEVSLSEDTAGSWRRFVREVEDDALLEKAIVAVDLRLPDRTVVRLAPEAATPEETEA